MRNNRRRFRAHDRATRPALEGLEHRFLLYATSGGAWTFGSRITYSFAPDGTNIGGDVSNLNGALAAQGIAASTWQQSFKQAAAVWQAVANINLAQVGDDGSSFGASGNQQDDGRFGDIRIGGDGGLGPGVLGGTFLPPPYNGGSLAGDIVMNTAQKWSSGGYDLLTVAIHEFGHALGMSHSQISSACMYASYTSTKQALTSDDTAGIQSIYAGRQPDGLDANGIGTYYGNAFNLSPYLNAQGQVAVSGLDITTSTDNDWYYVTTPAGTNGTMTVTMQSSNLSSLSPQFMLYNSSLYGFFSYGLPNSYGTTLTVQVTGVQPGQGYYIRATAANYGASGTGAYGLEVNFGSCPMGPIQPPNTVVTQQPDQGGGSANESTGGSAPGHGLLGGLFQGLNLYDTGLISIGSLHAAGDYLTTDALAGPSTTTTTTTPTPGGTDTLPIGPSSILDVGPVVVVPADGAAVVPGQHDRTTRAIDAVLAQWS